MARGRRWLLVGLLLVGLEAIERLDSNQVEQRKLSLSDIPCAETEGKHTCASRRRRGAIGAPTRVS